ncbi:SPASM domain-containing protein [Vibrio parahaemolyticus]|nr:SPASM domain-containing protein [Vibrio parahaemolyticus]MBM4964855.1 SPASM domain-containing protein [Vibrio parahaemolyticus]
MKQKLLRSSYNYFIDHDDGTVAFNAKTGVFALLNQETLHILKGQYSLKHIQDEQNLLSMGFLHTGNEKEEIVNNYIQSKKSKSKLNITIMPTMRCNFACSYCYQDNASDISMNERTQEALLSFIQDAVKTYESMSITWYGGEPLLEPDIIFSLASKIKIIAKNNNTRITRHSMVSNGTLLNRDIAEKLSYIGLNYIQVTIDSLLYKYPTNRGVINNNGEISILMKKILLANKYTNVSIRINVHSGNRKDIDRIISILKEHKLENSFYLARVTDDSKKFGSSSCEIDIEDYSSIEQDMPNRKLKSLVDKLRPRDSFCAATSGSMLVVDSSGNLYRCWHNADNPKYSIGSIFDGICDSLTEKRWRDYHPFIDEDCMVCKVAPICMGGCAHTKLFLQGKHTHQCETIRYQIEDILYKVGKTLNI